MELHMYVVLTGSLPLPSYLNTSRLIIRRGLITSTKKPPSHSASTSQNESATSWQPKAPPPPFWLHVLRLLPTPSPHQHKHQTRQLVSRQHGSSTFKLNTLAQMAWSHTSTPCSTTSQTITQSPDPSMQPLPCRHHVSAPQTTQRRMSRTSRRAREHARIVPAWSAKDGVVRDFAQRRPWTIR